MAITPALIRELREISGAGMSDCKKALEQAEGDVQKAVVVLREKGLASAAKKAGRIAAEGTVWTIISNDGQSGTVVEVNCETDFVAKNPEFHAFVESVANTILSTNATTVEELLEEKLLGSEEKISDVLKSKISLFGENINIRRFEKFVRKNAGFFQKYIHGNGKVAVLVDVESDSNQDELLEAAKNICMQITVMRPVYVSKDEIDESFIAQEKEILVQQALNEGKAPNVVEKMVVGRLNKRLKEVCLLDQEYIKDNNLTVGKYLTDIFKENNATAKVVRFIVFEKGEGIAKKEENFADEVSKAMQI